MCGRYTARLGNEAMSGFFGINKADVFLTPRFNIAPTQIAPVVLAAEGLRQFLPMRWGLTPTWATKEKSPPALINARGETLDEKVSFKGLLEQRCLVPADGYYEWLAIEGKKVPYYIQLRPVRPLAFAGLWQQRDGVLSFTIVTVAAAPAVERVHHRMPVVLTAEQELATWLEAPFAAARHLVRPSAESFSVYEVAASVSRPQNDLPTCILPVSEAATT